MISRLLARARARAFSTETYPRWALLKCPGTAHLSSFCRVHALIGGVINHIAVARFAHPLRSCRYALLLYAPPWTRAPTRDGLIAYHVVMAIIISRCWPCSTRGPREEFRQLTNNKFPLAGVHHGRSSRRNRVWANPPFSFLFFFFFYRATRKTDRPILFSIPLRPENWFAFELRHDNEDTCFDTRDKTSDIDGCVAHPSISMISVFICLRARF